MINERRATWRIENLKKKEPKKSIKVLIICPTEST